MFATLISQRKLTTITRVMIAFVLLALLVAMLPSPAAAANLARPKNNPSVSASISGKTLSVSASKLDNSHQYTVRARSSGSGWNRLAQIKPSKDGKFKGDYGLTGKLATAKVVEVCLRDNSTKKSYCARASH